MNGDGAAALESARGSGVDESGPPSRTLPRMGAFLRSDSSRSSFRRAAETSTRAACAPQIAAERSLHL
jgi:hypothetical protein